MEKPFKMESEEFGVLEASNQEVLFETYINLLIVYSY